MILGYDDIQEELRRGMRGLLIDPPPKDRAFQPASVDVRLGDKLTLRGQERDIRGFGVTITKKSGLVLGHTKETVLIPPHLTAQLDGKSTLARKGLAIHRTAGWIDPGFHGEITLEMTVTEGDGIHLVAGMYIGQLIFMQLRTPTSRWYGKPGLNSHYQGQRGPTPAAY